MTDLYSGKPSGFVSRRDPRKGTALGSDGVMEKEREKEICRFADARVRSALRQRHMG